MTIATKEQQAPIRNGLPAVQDLVAADLRTRAQHAKLGGAPALAAAADVDARKALGVERYGTALQPFNGRDALLDAYQEALDLAVYLRQAVCEGQALRPEYRAALRLAVALRARLNSR
jgi:hypothetical protein